MATDPALIDALRGISTATLTMQLLKRGIRRGWMAGTKPLQPGGPRLAGPAFTLRFVPGREDVSTRESYAAPSSLRDAIEAMPEGAVVAIDSRGEQGAGTLGDILAGRMKKRGVAGIVSDGPMRDVSRAVRAVGHPGLVQRGGCAALHRGPVLRRLAGAHRLRRRGGVSGRHNRGGRRRRRGSAPGAGRRNRRRRRGTGSAGSLDTRRDRARRAGQGPLSAGRGGPGAVSCRETGLRLIWSHLSVSDHARQQIRGNDCRYLNYLCHIKYSIDNGLCHFYMTCIEQVMRRNS